MSIQSEITRLQTAKNTMRNKLVGMGLVESSAKMDEIAAAVDNMDNNGGVDAEVKEGESFAIPAGWHDGTGTVKGVAGGGNYSLQAKSVTPTKSQQSVTPDAGYYGISSVNVAAIPEAYQDVTAVTAGAEDVLANKTIVDATGKIVAGTMANNGAVSKTLTPDEPSYTVPKGYHDGTGTVKIVPESKSATPSKAAQTVTPTAGKVLSEVIIGAIPDEYQDVTPVTAGAGDVLDGQIIVDAEGNEVEGTMPNNGAVAATIDTKTTEYTVPAGYHDGTGKVNVVTEEKSVTPTKAAQTIAPSTGKVLSKVNVAAIPANYIDTTDADATAAHILAGKTAYVDTTKLTGTMADNGDVSATMDGLTVMEVTIPAGYTSGGTISLTGDIEAALAAI